jgi:hypothetical protein
MYSGTNLPLQMATSFKAVQQSQQTEANLAGGSEWYYPQTDQPLILPYSKSFREIPPPHMPQDLQSIQISYITPDLGTQFLQKITDLYKDSDPTVDLTDSQYSQVENLYELMLQNKTSQ